MCRQCTLFPPRPKPRGKAPAGNVVATDPASVDADCDNGAALRGTRGSRRGDGDADRWLGAVARSARRRRQEDGRPATERGKEASGGFRVFALWSRLVLGRGGF